MDELKLRAILHSLLDTALQLSETIDGVTQAHPLDTSTGMIRGAQTNNELEIARQLNLKRATPARPAEEER